MRKRVQARHALFRLPASLPPHFSAELRMCSLTSPSTPNSTRPLDLAFGPSIAPALVDTRRGPSMAPPVYASPPYYPLFRPPKGIARHPVFMRHHPSCARPSLLPVCAESPFSSVRDRSISIPPPLLHVQLVRFRSLLSISRRRAPTCASPCVPVAYCRHSSLIRLNFLVCC